MKNIKEKFSHWLNYSPPGALSSKGWRLFKTEFKERAPIRYWFSNTAYRKYVLPVKWKYEAVYNWIRYRTRDRYHKLDIGLPPNYYSVETQMMHVNFNLLKDFVECELAWHTYAWSDEAKFAGWWHRIPFYSYFKQWFRPFRSREWAFRYFEWASKLDDPSLPPTQRCDHQAIAAREICALYIWWVDTVPSRKLHELPTFSDQGLGDMSILDSDFDKNEEDYKEYEKINELNRALEKEWEKEDEEMLIRLVKVRKELWT
jgi:hypothetical protein